MSLLKYIERKGLGEVNITSRFLAQHEDNILDRTKEICYEGEPSHVPDGDVNTGCEDVQIFTPQHTEIEPETMLGLDRVKLELVPLEKQTHSEDGKRHQLLDRELSSCSKRRKLVKESDYDVVVVLSSSSSLKSESLEEDDGATPHTVKMKSKRRWNRKQIVFTESDDSSDDREITMDAPKIDDHGLNQVGSVPDLLKWHEKKAKKEACLRDQIARYRIRMTLQDLKNARLVKKVKKLKDLKRSTLDKGREAIRMLARNAREHAKVTEALQKELDDARAKSEEKLKEVSEELKHEREVVEQVSSDRKWLIEEGFKYVIKKLLGSREFLEPLLAVESKMWSLGAHDGVVEGYSRCQDGVPLEDLGIYKPEAEAEVIKAADELKHMQFPYVVALSRCANSTLDELKALEPEGVEDEGKEEGTGCGY
ncbi:hypothetical protein QVD17_20538 [Tagetes erecta]|uniref:Uncharacterized protein n=1 Tax=Tagetes erecta TaxID=13708 RepID=A0AAD8NXZ8_TARER|nr:hypothetical protein QVD17_20538 [Tagetes erecta]